MSDTVDELLQQLDAAQQRLDAAQRVRDLRWAQHRATNDGIAESMRAIELAATTTQRRKLTRLHVAAEHTALAEYDTRRTRWGDNVTGALRALPCGADPTLTTLFIAHKIMGSYRFYPDRPDTPRTVTLLRHIRTDGAISRSRRRFRVPADQPLTSLADAVTALHTLHPERLRAFADDITDTLIAALPVAANADSCP